MRSVAMPEKRVQDPAPPPAEKRVRPAVALAPTQYEAVHGITYPDGPENVKRAAAGDMGKVTKWVRLEPGDDASDVPACDIGWLLEHGHIKKVT
jgi:hypothetical protein